MKVVLTADVPNVGRKGEVKEVADGYGRNFLIPRKLAIPASQSQLNELAAQAAAQQRREARQEAEHRALADRITQVRVIAPARVGEHGRLYGSITNGDVAERLSAALGVTIDKRHVELTEPIKQAGEHKVRVRIARGIDATATVEVVSGG